MDNLKYFIEDHWKKLLGGLVALLLLLGVVLLFNRGGEGDTYYTQQDEQGIPITNEPFEEEHPQQQTFRELGVSQDDFMQGDFGEAAELQPGVYIIGTYDPNLNTIDGYKGYYTTLVDRYKLTGIDSEAPIVIKSVSGNLYELSNYDTNEILATFKQ